MKGIVVSPLELVSAASFAHWIFFAHMLTAHGFLWLVWVTFGLDLHVPHSVTQRATATDNRIS